MLALSRRALMGAFGLSVATPVGATIAKPSPKRVVIVGASHIAGTSYYDIDLVRDELSVGASLLLRREPGNRYDCRAIEIVTPSGRKLGYVPRARNEALAGLMDNGVPAFATIVRRQEHRHPGTGALGWVEPTVDVGVVLG